MRIHKAIDPVGSSLSDWEIISRLSIAMGYKMEYKGSAEIFDEIASLTPSYAGMSYDRLGIDGIQWPCPSKDHPGTPFLHKDNFVRGKGKFHAVRYIDPDEMPDEDYPFFLTTGRMFAHFHTGTMTRRSSKLDMEQRSGYIEINPEDAEKLNIKNSDMVLSLIHI